MLHALHSKMILALKQAMYVLCNSAAGFPMLKIFKVSKLVVKQHPHKVQFY